LLRLCHFDLIFFGLKKKYTQIAEYTNAASGMQIKKK
jgi:hypothetical protein